ncbi:MAG: glycosyltransferase [Methanobacteriota archaeon]
MDGCKNQAVEDKASKPVTILNPTMQNAAPKVSVVMPVYNGERYLRQATDSILAQTFGDFEFIIVSEHGTNAESLAIIQSYSDPRIRHIHNTERLGLVESLNLGIREAKGELIARMDADDVSLPERFMRQVDFLRGNADVAVLGTAVELVDAAGDKLLNLEFPTSATWAKWQMFFRCSLPHPAVMARRNVLEEHEGYRHSGVEDYDLWLRVVRAHNICNLPEVLLKLRKHDDNRSLATSYEDALKRAHEEVAAYLGKEVDLTALRALREPETAKDAVSLKEAAKLLSELHRTFRTREGASEADWKNVAVDMKSRLDSIIRACKRKSKGKAFQICLSTLALRFK